MNCTTSLAVVFEKLRQMQQKINVIHEDGITYFNVRDMADKIADTFSIISNPNNYCEEFKRTQTTAEQQLLDFTSNNGENYNSYFNLHEYNYAISRAKNTALGPNVIYYQMLRSTPLEVNNHILAISNKFWSELFFSDQWKDTIMIPIPKLGKDHSKSINYRPIALTSCFGKTVERMINNRLLDYLEANGFVNAVQCECQSGRSTNDLLIRLETEVRRAFVLNEHVASIFLILPRHMTT